VGFVADNVELGRHPSMYFDFSEPVSIRSMIHPDLPPGTHGTLTSRLDDFGAMFRTQT